MCVCSGVAFHTALHNILRLLTLYLIAPSTLIPTVNVSADATQKYAIHTTTTELFQSSFYLGLGWGIAEATWGIVKGWFAGTRLWSDVLPSTQTSASRSTASEAIAREEGIREADFAREEAGYTVGEDAREGGDSSNESLEEEEEDLEVKIQALERMKGRRGKSDVIAAKNSSSCFPLHRSRASSRHTFSSMSVSFIQGIGC